jgi:hypothetical protein
MSSIFSALKRKLTLTLLALALSIGAAASPDQAKAGIGEDLRRSADENLLKFFGIYEADSSIYDESRLVLRPETPYLSEVTQLRVRINDQGQVERMELWMEESFMRDEWVRAYDLAGWFLNSAVPVADASSIELFKLEIQYPQDKEIHYMNITVPSDLPKEPSRAYKTFTGKLPTYNQKLGSCEMRMEHTEIGGKTWLRMMVLDENAPAITHLSKGAKFKI